MTSNHLLLRLLGTTVYLLVSVVSNEGLVNVHTFFNSAYQVSVFVHGHGDVCGGGIIGEKFVLTAAHCVLNHNRHLRSTHISIFAGTINLNKTGPPAVAIKVKEVFFPKEFHPMIGFPFGDIAVLKLVDFLPKRHLWKLEFPRNYYFAVDTVVDISGYGWNKYNNGIGRTDGRLRLSTARVLSDEECESAYPVGAINPYVHLCAKLGPEHLINRNRSYGVCNGDDGSPLVHQGTTVIGILSRIPSNCNEREEPGIYTRVTHYLMMISNVMECGRDPEMMLLHT